VFSSRFEKAVMPQGAFEFLDADDRDDLHAMSPAPGYAELVEPARLPSVAFQASERFLAWAGTAEVAVAALENGSGVFAEGITQALEIRADLSIPGTALEAEPVDLASYVGEEKSQAWDPLKDAWRSASRLFRVLVVLIPAGMALSMLMAATTVGPVRDAIERRAAIELGGAFDPDLSGWFGARDWARTWTHDRHGVVRTGQLGLYRPSISMKDYRLEFPASFDQQAIGWAYRAGDLNNYYAERLVRTGSGARTALALDRYAVIGGRESGRVLIPISYAPKAGAPLRIRMDVAGNGFRTYLDGRLVDYWSDDRLSGGGVGLFGGPGDRPRVSWMKVGYHDDLWGKVCASLAPM